MTTDLPAPAIPSFELTGPPLLFLDLDDTVRHGYTHLGRFVNNPEDVTVFPAAVTMMRRWRELGGRIVGVTNQGGVALGHLTLDALGEITAETYRQTDDLFDEIRACPHAPSAGCFCRKPSPGMLLAAASEMADRFGDSARDRCLMVGDRPEDEQAAAAAGIPFENAAVWRARAGEST